MEQEIQIQDHLIDTLKDLFAGSLAGFGICLSGHPFDTIKVRMQTSNLSLIQTIQTSFNSGNGVFSFFQGMGSPLSTVPLINAIVFGSYELSKKIFRVEDSNDFSFSQGLLSGMFAGFTNSIVVGPIELLKCRLQIQRKNCNKLQIEQSAKQQQQQSFKGPLQLLRHIYSTEGIKGVFKGQLITQWREISCYAVQFATYEELKQLVLNKYGITNLSMFQSFLLGGVAGIMCWVFSYPQDIIKTQLQCDTKGLFKKRNVFLNISEGGIISCSKFIYQNEGILAFWKGFSPCLIRAFYANSIGFLIYEESRQLLYPQQKQF